MANIFEGTGQNLTPGQKIAQTSNGDLADYFRNPAKYEAAAKAAAIKQQQQPQDPMPGGQTSAQKAQSDAAYAEVLKRLTSSNPNDQQAPAQQPATPPPSPTDLVPGESEVSQDEMNKAQQDNEAKQKALLQMLGGPRGMN